jgi:hypothetical protein
MYTPSIKEGFKSSSIETRIRSTLDSMTNDGLCDLYSGIRDFMKKTEMANPSISDTEAAKRVEATLAIKIPGGALPCPLLKYPIAGSKDLDWLNYLQSIPLDFGARVVFMALYAKKELSRREVNIKASLAGQPTKTDADFDKDDAIAKMAGISDEPFTGLCPPTVADTRRQEKANKKYDSCLLPEDMTPKELEAEVSALLDAIVSTKKSLLSEKGIKPDIDIRPIINKAKTSHAYIAETKKKAENGSLINDVTIPGN